jgi:hypothetical protein
MDGKPSRLCCACDPRCAHKTTPSLAPNHVWVAQRWWPNAARTTKPFKGFHGLEAEMRLSAVSTSSLQRHVLHRRSGQSRPVDHRRGDKLATAIVAPPTTTPASASPIQAAASSNPHRRQPPTRPPRVPVLGGFRTPALSARG